VPGGRRYDGGEDREEDETPAHPGCYRRPRREPLVFTPSMEPEIVPEPSERDREALDEALARLLSEREDPYSEWWRAGIREVVTPEEEPA
jgi:hypothetical protein